MEDRIKALEAEIKCLTDRLDALYHFLGLRGLFPW